MPASQSGEQVPRPVADIGRRVLDGNVQMNDSYPGGERTGGKVGRGAENKVPFVAAVSLTEEDRPLRVRLTPVTGFTSEEVVAWVKGNVAPGSVVFSDGLACFAAVTGAGCNHQPTVMAGRKPKEVPSSSGSTPFWAISRPASQIATMPSTCKSMLHAILERSVIASTGASICASFTSACWSPPPPQCLGRCVRFG